MTDEELESRAFDDLDEIREMADSALGSLADGDIGTATETIKNIRDTAAQWEDP